MYVPKTAKLRLSIAKPALGGYQYQGQDLGIPPGMVVTSFYSCIQVCIWIFARSKQIELICCLGLQLLERSRWHRALPIRSLWRKRCLLPKGQLHVRSTVIFDIQRGPPDLF